MAYSKNDHIIDLLVQDPMYKITEEGFVYLYIEEKGIWNLLTPKGDKNGYKRIKYRYKNIFVHRLIYRKFNGQLDSSLVVNHKDGNPMNNHKDNLELISQSQNMTHSFTVLNRKPVVGNFNVNYAIAQKIRQLHKEGQSFKKLTKMFKISKTTVSYIINNKTWISDENTPINAVCYPSEKRYKDAMPKWETVENLKKFYKNRPKGMVVDHIIPIKGENVSGLHCVSNLQYLSEGENLSKHNRFRDNDNT